MITMLSMVALFIGTVLGMRFKVLDPCTGDRYLFGCHPWRWHGARQ